MNHLSQAIASVIIGLGIACLATTANLTAQSTSAAGQLAPKTVVTQRLLSATSVQFSWDFSPPRNSATDVAFVPRLAPDGLDEYDLPGINLTGYTRQLGIAARTVVIDSVDMVEIPWPNVQFSSVNEVFPSGPSAPKSGLDRQPAQRAVFSPQGIYPVAWAQVRLTGRAGDLPVSQLIINPYRYVSYRGTIQYARRIVLHIETTQAIDLALMNDVGAVIRQSGRDAWRKRSTGIQSASLKSNTIFAPDGNVYRLYTKEDGVYRVKGKDLIQLGVPLQAIDTRTLKLYNRGIEIPLYVNDHADNNLSDNDFIEFFGERKKTDSVPQGSDLKKDLYAIYNVYYLVWGGRNGRRLVEENGSVTQSTPSAVRDISDTTYSFPCTLRFEKDESSMFDVIAGNAGLGTFTGDFDILFWKHFFTPQSPVPLGTARYDLTAYTPHPDVKSADPVSMSAAFRGATTPNDAGGPQFIMQDHAMGVSIEGNPALYFEFNGDGYYIATTQANARGSVTNAMLNKSGLQSVSMQDTSPYKPDQAIENMWLNWFEISYQRLYQADRNALLFRIPRNAPTAYYKFGLKGFTTPSVRLYRKGISLITNPDIRLDSTQRDSLGRATYKASFISFAASGEEQFYAVSEDNILKPAMRKDSPTDLKDVANNWNYLIVVDDSTSDYKNLGNPGHPLNKFAAFKQKTDKFNVGIVRVSHIYDQFGNGSVNPHAIRAFLKYAYENWAVPPRYVFIVGNGDPLYKNDTLQTAQDSLTVEYGYVPSLLFQGPVNGATQSDYYFGCFQGEFTLQNDRGTLRWTAPDPLQEVYTGRLCVGSVTDIGNYVDKLIRQEGSPDYGPWRNRMGIIAGGPGSDDLPFNQFAYNEVKTRLQFLTEPYRMMANPAYVNTRYYNPYTKSEAQNNRVLPLMNDTGVGLLLYMGHGGSQEWDGSGRLNTSQGNWSSDIRVKRDNIDSLTNIGRMPAILSFSCNSGALRFNQSLMAEMMIRKNHGPISGYGACAFSFVNNNLYMCRSIFSILSNPKYRNLSIGEQVSLIKSQYTGLHFNENPYLTLSMNGMCTIYGDPSLRIPITTDSTTLYTPKQVVKKGENFTVTGTFPFTPKQVFVTVFDTTEVPFISQEVPPTGTAFSFTQQVPASYGQLYMGIRVYAHDGNGRSVSASLRQATASANLLNIRPVTPLAVGKPAVFDIRNSGQANLDSVWADLQNVDGTAAFERRRLEITKLSDGYYRTAPIEASYLEAGSRISLRLFGPIYVIEGRTQGIGFVVPGGPDAAAYRMNAADSTSELYADVPSLAVIPNESIRPVPTAKGARLAATIYNWGDAQVQDIGYSLSYVDTLTGETIPLDTGRRVTIGPRDSVTVTLSPTGQYPFMRYIGLNVSPDFFNIRKQDIFSGNDQAYNWVAPVFMMYTPEFGFTADNNTTVPFLVDKLAELNLKPASTGNTGILMGIVGTVPPASTQGLNFIRLGDSARYLSRTLRLMATAGGADTVSLRLRLKADTSDPAWSRSASRVMIARFDPRTKLWTGYATSRPVGDSSVLEAVVSMAGEYALVVSSDQQPPEIVFSADGQKADTTWSISQDAKIDAVITDQSGIFTNPDKIVVTLDAVPMKTSTDYVITDSSSTANSVNLRILKSNPGGRHTICITATDKVGNTASKCATFSVVSEQTIKFYGTFPNPFRENIFMAYELQAATTVDVVELKLFTTAGKLVKKMVWPNQDPAKTVPFTKGGTGDPTRTGYHEIWWDGIDDDGVAVSNGVYFYRLRIKSGDQIVQEYTGAIARVR